MRLICAVVGLLVVLLGLAAPVLAQSATTGSIQGTVKDEKGGVLPGATVTASSEALPTGQTATVTDERGNYRFPSLPPGRYAIEVQMASYKTSRQEDVRVRLGQAIAVNLTLSIAELTEEVTVVGAAPTISIVSNTVSTNFDQSFLKTQPLPRNYYTVIRAAPGVNIDYTASSGSAMLAYGGTEERQNAFTLDGVNVADAGAGQHWMLPAIQWMQEIEVGGLGANAEYGGYTGGVINGITKSGSNDFKGEVEYYYQPESWSSDNNAPEIVDSPSAPSEFKFNDLAISLGGPIIKDKLWYFVSGERWQQVTTPYQRDVAYRTPGTSDRVIPRYLGKLTWQATPKNRVNFMVEYDSVENERRGISDLTLAEASSRQDAPGVTAALHLESFVNSNNFFNIKITGYDGRDDYLPYFGVDTPGHVDDNTGTEFVNQDIRELNHRHIVTLNASWNLFADGLFGGADSHSFKFGGEYEAGSSSDYWRRNGGFTYYDWSGDCAGETEDDQVANLISDPTCGPYYIERGYGEYDTATEYTGFALYAQDSMTIGQWTINAGLRYGGYDAGWQPSHGGQTVYEVTFLDPRIGAVWDVRGDARTAVKAHWGRYHEKMYAYLYDREASGNGVIPDQDCYYNYDTGEYDDCDTPTVIAAQMGEVNHPYVDETVLTFEQQFGREHVLGLDLIDRNFGDIMGMVNTNDDYSVFNFNNPLTGEPLPVYILNSPPVFELTTDNPGKRDYQSVILRYEKRHSHGWSLRSSLVWTDLTGNVLKNNGYADELRDRNGLTNADGKMDLSYSEWEYKLSGVVDLPLGLQLSAYYTYLSGWYWTPYVRISDLGDYGFNGSTGRNVFIEPRGSEQFPNRSLLDMRLAWNKTLGDRMMLTLSLEGFNLFNKGTVLDNYPRYANCYIEDGPDGCYTRSNYNDTYQVESPRQFRAGARFAF